MACNLPCLTVLAVAGLTLSAEGSAKSGCPTTNTDMICVWYNDQCKNDDANCPEGEICCEDNCGTFCTKPAPATKPGVCPPKLPGSVGICAEMCIGDDSCPGNKKCCSNGCGHECKTPIGIRKSAIRKKRSFPNICDVGTPLQGFICGIGQPCPIFYTCITAPDETYAVCCPEVSTIL